MKSKYKYLGLVALAVFGISYAMHSGFAEPSPLASPSVAVSVMASPAPVATVAAPAGDVSGADFMAQIMSLIQTFGGLTWIGKISAIILLVVASMKVSFVKPLWDKVGAYQVFVAPALSIALGVLAMKPFSWAGLLAYLFAGAGAIMLHEILDGVKALPGLGAMYVSAITFFEGLLGSPNASSSNSTQA